MQRGFGGGGFNSNGSMRDNANRYYAYKQTSGGGSGKSPLNGCLITILVIFLFFVFLSGH